MNSNLRQIRIGIVGLHVGFRFDDLFALAAVADKTGMKYRMLAGRAPMQRYTVLSLD